MAEEEGNRLDLALSSHISAILGLGSVRTPEVIMYVSALRSEGWDIPEDFDDLTVDDLKNEPFNFKNGHLKKVRFVPRVHPLYLRIRICVTFGHPSTCSFLLRLPFSCPQVARSREKKAVPPPTPTRVLAPPLLRGQCTLCGLDVLESQPRLKDPKTNLYQHEDCRATDYGSSVPSALEPQTTSRASVVVSESAIIEPDANAEKAADEVQLEVVAVQEAAQVQNDAMQIADAAATHGMPTTTLKIEDIDRESAQPQSSSSTPTNQMMLAAKIQSLLPDGKHAFLSYQWDVQDQVKEIKALLNERNMKCWMDIDGGMKSDIYDSMAEGVQGAACVICFMTQAYQDSVNCKLELKFAQQSGVPIIPVMMQAKFTAKSWLAILTAGSIWTPMYESASVPNGITKLIAQAQYLVPGLHGDDDANNTAANPLDELRDEIMRLRYEMDSTGPKNHVKASVGMACSLPLEVPELPAGLCVSPEMRALLVFVTDQTPKAHRQIGLCGMGGLGKTTISTWLVKHHEVRSIFDIICWVSLGQDADPDKAICTLYKQVAGADLPETQALAEKRQALKKAFDGIKVLLILDDIWEADIVPHLSMLDDQPQSKTVLSSRIRVVTEVCGGFVVDVGHPTEDAAVDIFLASAGIDGKQFATSRPEELKKIVKFCKYLPLALGIAGKLCHSLFPVIESPRDLDEVYQHLQDEFSTGGQQQTVEEVVIRTTLKSIKGVDQKEVINLFYSLALIPEDVRCPLDIVSIVFESATTVRNESNVKQQQPSRLQIRKWLKLLIDRSLVMGSVDAPHLHDIVLAFVTTQFNAAQLCSAHRRVVELLRDRQPPGGWWRWLPPGGEVLYGSIAKYVHNNAALHTKAALVAPTEGPEGAIAVDDVNPAGVAWLDSHHGGKQDELVLATAVALGSKVVETLAVAAEQEGCWWTAARRFRILSHLRRKSEGVDSALSALRSCANACTQVMLWKDGEGEACDRMIVQAFEAKAVVALVTTWQPDDIVAFMPRIKELLLTPAIKQAEPTIQFSASLAADMYPPYMGGDFLGSAKNMHHLALRMIKFAEVTHDDIPRKMAMCGAFWMAAYDYDWEVKQPDHDWTMFGEHGQRILKTVENYDYDAMHLRFNEVISGDVFVSVPLAAYVVFSFGNIDVRCAFSDRILHSRMPLDPTHVCWKRTCVWSMAFLSRVYCSYRYHHKSC
jgi:hypothetical protein